MILSLWDHYTKGFKGLHGLGEGLAQLPTGPTQPGPCTIRCDGHLHGHLVMIQTIHDPQGEGHHGRRREPLLGLLEGHLGHRIPAYGDLRVTVQEGQGAPDRGTVMGNQGIARNPVEPGAEASCLLPPPSLEPVDTQPCLLGHILGHLGVSALPGQPTHQAAGVSPVEGFQGLLVPTLPSLHQGIVRAQTTLTSRPPFMCPVAYQVWGAG